MFGRLRFKEVIGRMMVRNRPHSDLLQMNGVFYAHHYRQGRLIGEYRGKNGITVVGKNHILDVCFGNSSPVTQIDPWYIGLVNNTPAPVLSENDTLASHSGWAEFASYTGNRQAWDDANASAKIKGTTTPSQFDFTGSGTVYGILIASVASGTSGLLWSTGAFDTTVAVVNGDQLKVTYGIRC